jgi:hypothetical protein
MVFYYYLIRSCPQGVILVDYIRVTRGVVTRTREVNGRVDKMLFKII